jgi:CubicO group peptidase (beta-lactamase class C family)
MNVSSRIRRNAKTVAFIGAAALLPLTAMAAATLQVVQGSGEFQTLDTAVTVTAPTAFTMQWTTDQAAAGGTWKVTNSASQVVASGEATPAPAVGHFLRFTIPQNAFLPASTASTLQYKISIQPHDGVMQALGAASPSVAITEVANTSTPPIVFGPSANFPKVDIVSYDEKIGVVPQTQFHYAGADITLRVTNKSRTVTTDPAWLAVKDANILMRQNTSGVSIPSLQPGASTTVSVHLDAVLPPAQSQLPEDLQYSQWNAQYRNVCGPQLSSVLDWRGPQAQTPIGSHIESLLVKEGWSDYAKVPPNTPICSGTQCVSTCQIEKNIHAQLDGNVTGYSFFVGQYPKFTGYGDARIAADAPETKFKSDTKITVASVSKLVTTIAAVRLLDQKGISLDTPIAAYLPADWSMQSNYIKNITFAQLLGQRSGIKDYGNVSMDYAQLKKFFTQSVNTMANTSCQPSSVVNPANPVNVSNQGWCYSNYNFAIMRVLLPKVAGYVEDANQATRPTTLANQYTAIVQQNVFNLVGQGAVTCKPPVNSTNYAFAYKTPASNANGTDFGDVSGICGAAGWYLSVEDMAKVMLSLNAKDGKILAASNGKDLFETMRQRGLGWDVDNNGELEKNGGWGANCNGNSVCDNITTSVAMFGPVTGPRVLGVLFINSNITGGGGAQGVLEKAYKDALYTKP